MNQEEVNQKNKMPSEKPIKEKTIMPTMLDEEERTKVEKKQDLKDIIPVSTGETTSDALTSKDTLLKSDGSIVLGTYINEEQIMLKENAKLPNQIDIAARKEEFLKNKNKKKQKKEHKNPTEIKKQQKSQTITSVIALCIIAFLGIFYFYYKNRPNEEDFIPLEVHVELGSKLPIRKNAYVKPAKGELSDELSYTIDTSSVIIDEIGKYQFSVWHKGVTKYGVIIIEDTTAPILEIRDVTITEGTNYEPETFVAECRDITGCNYSFEDKNTKEKYQEPGEYEVYIIAKDAFENKTIKKANLKIEAIGMVKFFTKSENFDFTKGYALTTSFDLHFTDFIDDAIILNGTKYTTYEYQEENKYQEEKNRQYGLEGYSFDDSKLQIIYKENANVVGNNYSKLKDVTNYLINNGYQER